MNEADIIIGIDPDSKGAVTILYADGSIEIFKVTMDNFWQHLSAELEQVSYMATAFIEKPFMPYKRKGQKHGHGNPISYGKQMYIVGMLEGVCIAHGILVHHVAAKLWQRSILQRDMAWAGKGKQTKYDSRFTAQSLHPGYLFNLTDGQADSVCIAHYGKQQMKIEANTLFQPTSGKGINFANARPVV